MATGTYALSISAGGLSIQRTITRSADAAAACEIAVPAGKTGQLTTRTDNETGTLTMASGHGITTGAIIDLYWATGARYGITVGTVATNSVPIGADNSGTGDALPTNLTSIVACVQVPFNVSIDGDNLKLIGIELAYASTSESAESHLSLRDGSAAEIAGLDLIANTPRVWDIQAGATNNFTGNPIEAGIISNASSANAATLKMCFVVDATP